MDETQDPIAAFAALGLGEAVLQGIAAAGFQSPRPIQEQAIPPALAGRDILGLAQTGTGKTAAFALPMLERLKFHRKAPPRALVIAPTRELATQIATEIHDLAAETKVRVLTIFGGTAIGAQVRGLRRNPDVIVGCPGRLLDLVKQRELDLSAIEMLVLDEADHMFDMGFLPTIRRILSELPRERQNLMFSATMPGDMRGLAEDVLEDPVRIELATRQPAQTIEHALVAVAEERKRDLLQLVLAQDDCDTAIVFARTKHRARRLMEFLRGLRIYTTCLEGDMSQQARDRAMQGFRDGKFPVLVATDIVARGIDVAGVSYVINFDVPRTPDAYTHRIGRTGRGDEEGRALTFITRADQRWVQATERALGRSIARHEFRGFDARYDERSAGRGGGERGGGYRGKKVARKKVTRKKVMRKKAKVRPSRGPKRGGGGPGRRGSGR